MADHPKVEVLGLVDHEGQELLRCPECGNVDILDCYDVGGADEDCVFCNQCNTELRL